MDMDTRDQQENNLASPGDASLESDLPPDPASAHDSAVATAMESVIPTPSQSAESTPPTHTAHNEYHAPEESAPSSPSHHGQHDDSAASTADQQQQHQQQRQTSAKPASQQPLKRRPRRTGQPLHLLLQDCSRQHISGYLCKKTPEEITAIVSDKAALALDLRNYSNEFVLTSARDRVIGEVDEQGKELLQDVDPERDVIKQRFEDESSVFKSYDDAIHDIRVDLYLDGIKPRKQESEEDNEETAAKNIELTTVIEVWDQFHKRIEIEPKRSGRSGQSPYPGRGVRPTGPPGARPHPYATGRFPPPAPGPPAYGPPFAGPPGANGPPFRDSRGRYPDRPPYRDDYYADRRDDYRRSDYDRRDPRDMGMRAPGPGPMGRPDSRDLRDGRDPRDYRDRPPPPTPSGRGDGPFGPGGGRYDDRRRDRPEAGNTPPSRDSRHFGPGSATGSPLTSHPSLPPKPHAAAFDSMPTTHAQHPASNAMYPVHYPQTPHQQPPAMDPQAAQAGYGGYGAQQGYAMVGQPDYSTYSYAGYAQDPASLAAQQQYAYSAAAGGWDMSGGNAAAATAAAVAPHAGAVLQLQPFSSSQSGRHKTVPLPIDFMSGPSGAPRLSMPEPHEVLGTIRGVIIRDAHGNIGLSQYHFTQATQ
ncbi:hypothetical protein BGZ99_010338 [Dissophora globulifera]|uniref:Uncharacterized protein n=1 Tax=Dissophora globulifera TaxID=979702 RepID=A0A9P6RPZ1_9FUNG|nr:hypothetical protein BGZ99_010338 [Dissophora globulifera]